MCGIRSVQTKLTFQATVQYTGKGALQAIRFHSLMWHKPFFNINMTVALMMSGTETKSKSTNFHQCYTFPASCPFHFEVFYYLYWAFCVDTVGAVDH